MRSLCIVLLCLVALTGVAKPSVTVVQTTRPNEALGTSQTNTHVLAKRYKQQAIQQIQQAAQRASETTIFEPTQVALP